MSDPTLLESSLAIKRDQLRAYGLFNNGPEEDGYVDEFGRTVPSVQKVLKALQDSTSEAVEQATEEARLHAENAAESAGIASQQGDRAASEADRAAQQAGAAQGSADIAAARANESNQQAQLAANARDKAQQWASAPQNTPVEGGLFSAFHWASKSAAFAAQVQAAADGIQPLAAISVGRNAVQAVSGTATWVTVTQPVEVFKDATFFAYEASTGSIVPNLVVQERLEIFGLVRFAAVAGGSYRAARLIAVNPANAGDLVVMLEREAVPSSSVDTVLELNNIVLPPRNWKIQLQVRHDYSIAGSGQSINIKGSVLTVSVTRGKQGPPGVAVRETVRTYPFTASAAQTDFPLADAFNQVMLVTVGGVPQAPGDYTVVGQTLRLSDSAPAGLRVMVTTSQDQPGQASLLRVQAGTLPANATQLALADPLDVLLFVSVGGVAQSPVADFNPNYQANRVDFVAGIAQAVSYVVAYRRTAS